MEREVVIAGALRTPIGKYARSLRNYPATKLGSIVIKALLEKYKIPHEEIDLLIMGNVIAAGNGQNPARLAGLMARIPPNIGGFTVNQVCASGLSAITIAAEKVKYGYADLIIAGGMESMSRAPFLIPPEVRWGVRIDAVNPFRAIRITDAMVHDGLWDVIYGEVMGVMADEYAKKIGITREEADEFSYNSHMRALKATKDGKFKDEIVPITEEKNGENVIVLDRDEGIREDTSMEKLAKLKPVFSKDGIITAGNASQLSDGASAVIVTTRDKAKELKLDILGTLVDWDHTFMEPKDWVIAPAPSVKKLLERNNLSIDEIDLIEHNEAFAVASLAVLKELDYDYNRFNIHGGAVAMGHPIGASGARILTTLLNAMKQNNSKLGIATICHGGGGAVSVLVKR
ncbi:MAG: thiolase family protein [Candidatus Njordarchaeia archaeon]